MSDEQTQAVIDHVLSEHSEYQRKRNATRPGFSWEHVVEAAVALGIVGDPREHGAGKCEPLQPHASDDPTDDELAFAMTTGGDPDECSRGIVGELSPGLRAKVAAVRRLFARAGAAEASTT
jgi:hypothetical protein